MKPTEVIAKEIFATIEEDLRDRRGIRREWDQVSNEIQEEIRSTNEREITKILNRHYRVIKKETK